MRCKNDCDEVSGSVLEVVDRVLVFEGGFRDCDGAAAHSCSDNASFSQHPQQVFQRKQLVISTNTNGLTCIRQGVTALIIASREICCKLHSVPLRPRSPTGHPCDGMHGYAAQYLDIMRTLAKSKHDILIHPSQSWSDQPALSSDDDDHASAYK